MRVADGRVDVLERLDRRARVDDARARRQVDLDEAIAREDGAGRALLVERDDQRMVRRPPRARERRRRGRGGRDGGRGAVGAKRRGSGRATTGWSWEALQHAGLHGGPLAEVDDRPVVGARELGEPAVGVHRARVADDREHRDVGVAVRVREAVVEVVPVVARVLANEARLLRARRRRGEGACRWRSRP